MSNTFQLEKDRLLLNIKQNTTMKFSIILFSIACSLCGCSQLSIGKVSYLVGKKQDDEIGQFKKSTFYQVRKQLFDKYPSILNVKIDTVCFMEKYEIEEASYYGTIWTKSDTVNYSLFANEIKLSNTKPFTNKAMSLIYSWDTVSIRNEERKYSTTPRIVYAARATVTGNKCQIDTIKMRDLIF